MAVSFDLYLNRRLTECDLLISSLTYRAGITAADRVVIESCIAQYVLCQYIAIHTGSELITRIDRSLKQCYELFGANAELRVSVNPTEHTFDSATPQILQLSVADLHTLTTKAESARSSLELAAAIAKTQISTVMMPVPVGLELSTDVSKTLKTSVEHARTSMALNTGISGTSARVWTEFAARTELDAVVYLSYQFYNMAQSAAVLTAAIQDIRISSWLGSGSSRFVITGNITKLVAWKYAALDESIDLLAGVAEIIRKYIAVNSGFSVDISLREMLLRLRPLSEHDGLTLADMDNQTLFDLDYEVL